MRRYAPHPRAAPLMSNVTNRGSADPTQAATVCSMSARSRNGPYDMYVHKSASASTSDSHSDGMARSVRGETVTYRPASTGGPSGGGGSHPGTAEPTGRLTGPDAPARRARRGDGSDPIPRRRRGPPPARDRP